MNLHRLAVERLAAGRPVRVGLIGAGKFGSMFLAQAPRSPLLVTVIADLDVDRAQRACFEVGWSAALVEDTVFTDSADELLARGDVDVVEATGNPVVGWSTPWPASPRASIWWRSTWRPTRSSGRGCASPPTKPAWCIRWPTAINRR
jgi:predicted homoserine dehydrogenase-like protein